MVVQKELILDRLGQLDTVQQKLARYRGKTAPDLSASLSLRWTVERGLIAACNIIFDVANHILGGQFGAYAETYEDSLRLLRENKVVSEKLYPKMKGLGGFRNVLVH